MTAQFLRAFLALAVVLLSFRTQGADESRGSRLPKFEDFPVTENWKGTAVPLKLLTPLERLYRSKLRQEAKGPPSFAGHFSLATWGCGTNCVGGAVINLESGKVFPPPLGGKGAGVEYWIFCVDYHGKESLDFRPDSSLFIVRCGHQYGDNQDDVHYLLWKDQHFIELMKTPGASQ